MRPHVDLQCMYLVNNGNSTLISVIVDLYLLKSKVNIGQTNFISYTWLLSCVYRKGFWISDILVLPSFYDIFFILKQ